MTSLKVDTIVFTNNSLDTSLALSGIVDTATYNATTGTIDPVTKNITTTGTISGATYKTSNNVTVISGSGDARPYGLFSFPPSVGTSGYILNSNGDGSTSWIQNSFTSGLTTAFYIALNKC